MTDTTAFKVAVTSAGISYGEIAEQLGITRGSLYNKIHNRSDFRQLELYKLFDLLNLDTWEKRQAIFFVDLVE